MQYLPELFECEMCKKIIDSHFKKSAKYFDKYYSKDSIPSRPMGSSIKKVSQDACRLTMNFFENEVIPFANLLENFSSELTKTLTFDLHKIYTNVTSYSEKLVKSGDLIIENVPKSTAKVIKEMFRYILWPWIKNSYFVSRGLIKPYGYPGDYEIVEEMYNGNTKSLGLGYIYDSIFLETQLCQGLRNRKDQMKQILTNYLNLKVKDTVTILNVGCGGSRELREMYFTNDGEGVNIYLLDFDSKALDFSISHLKPNISKAKLVPLNLDVRKLISKENEAIVNVDQFDLIYSIGLFDYLSDRAVVDIIKNILILLRSDGLLIFAHKDHTLYNPRIADWFCDWKYYPRTQDDFKKIFNDLNIDSNNISFSREKDGYIFFVEIKKPSGIKGILKQ